MPAAAHAPCRTAYISSLWLSYACLACTHVRYNRPCWPALDAPSVKLKFRFEGHVTDASSRRQIQARRSALPPHAHVTRYLITRGRQLRTAAVISGRSSGADGLICTVYGLCGILQGGTGTILVQLRRGRIRASNATAAQCRNDSNKNTKNVQK